jgi:RNA polymerase sigma-70 factor (ECF subfamily)
MTVCEPAAALAAVSDDDVMVCVKAGSADAFGVLYDRYRNRAYRVAWSVCHDAGRAEEAVQEAFISLWKTRMTYDRQVGKVAPWVLTVARYRAIDIARSNRPHAEHRASEDILHTVRGPNNLAEQVQDRAQARDVRNVLAGLPDAQREVITLAFYGQLTHSEIASYLELPAGTVKSRVRLGLQRLRGEIKRVAD